MTPGAPFDAEVADAPPGGEGWWLAAADGTRLRAVVWRGGGAGTALLFPGRTEFAEKYGRVVGELVRRGLAVAVIDWRGQGLSDRHPRDAMLGHVRDFADYQLDVGALLDLAEALGLPTPRFLVAHSMGGCIALRTLVERRDLAGAVFSAPMWGLHLRALTRGIAGTLSAVAGRVGLGDRPMPGTRRPPALPFAGNVLTSDPEIFRWCQGQLVRHPELALGGPSLAWTGSALREAREVATGPMPHAPALVLLGSAEVVVSRDDVVRVARRLPQGELVDLAGARHEIFMERPELTGEVWRRVDGFLERLPGPAARSAAVGG
ncbi:MAG: alpha/beta hydrolase [Amaricoccus sp.]